MQEATGAPLTEAERRKIDSAFAQLGELDYYEILGLERDVERGAVKKAYYRISKEFHPDRFFRRPLGVYKEKLDILFDVITKAYNTLNNVKQREAYDSEHPPKATSSKAAPGNSGGGSTEIQARGAGSAPPTRGAKRSASQVRGARTVPQKRRAQRPQNMPPPKPMFQRALARQLLERQKKARLYFTKGKELIEQGDFQNALSNLQLACSFDSNNSEAKKLLDQASAEVADVRAEVHYQRGLQQEMLGADDVARRFFQMAVDCKPKKGYYYYKLSQHQSSKKELRAKLENMKSAAAFEPKNVEILLDLAKTYEDAGMPRNALREYEKILLLSKGHDQAQKAVRKLRGVI